jgi:hypothetical protein
MRALGQTAAASIEVLEDTLRIEVSLPWILAKAATPSSNIAQGNDPTLVGLTIPQALLLEGRGRAVAEQWCLA